MAVRTVMIYHSERIQIKSVKGKGTWAKSGETRSKLPWSSPRGHTGHTEFLSQGAETACVKGSYRPSTQGFFGGLFT